ncbi:MAG: serine protease [Acetatifactor sp.]|nr:serine protease [Acetatifactor sp.]
MKNDNLKKEFNVELNSNGAAMVASEKKVCEFTFIYRAISICTLVMVAVMAVFMLNFSNNSSSYTSVYPEYIVKITNGNLRGMGEIIYNGSDGLVVLTAAHCVTGSVSGSVSIEFFDGFRKEAANDEVYISSDSDVAFIIFGEKKDYEACSLMDDADEGLEVDSVCFAHRVYESDPLTDSGFYYTEETISATDDKDVNQSGEEGMEPTHAEDLKYPKGDVVWGKVLDPWIYMEDFDSHMIYLKMNVSPGMSGGGLHNSEGKLVGMLVGGTDDGEAAAVPWAVIKGELMSLADKTLPNFYN